MTCEFLDSETMEKLSESNTFRPEKRRYLPRYGSDWKVPLAIGDAPLLTVENENLTLL